MYAAAAESVFPHPQASDFFKDSHQHCFLQLLEEEFISTLHSNALTRGFKDSSYEDHRLCLPGDPSGSDLPISSISDYDIEGEDFLFEAPDPIMEEPLLPLDSVTEAISMISGVEDIISGEAVISAETDSLETNNLLNEIYSELTEDLLVKTTNEKLVSELLNVEVPTLQEEDVMRKEDVQRTEKEDRLLSEGPLQKSVSSGCLTPTDGIDGWSAGLDLIRIQGIDPGVAFRMRRAYSEGDIKNLGNRETQAPAMVLPPLKPCLITMGSVKSEERMQKLVRYRTKKFKRNFGRKIKYACRKALADVQPRVRGRFARTEESEALKTPH